MEDDFTVEGIDRNSLDDAGKKIYDQLMGQFKPAYTKKTQALAEEKKAWEVEQKKLVDEAQQYKAQVEQFNAWWNALTPQQQNYYQSLNEQQQQQVLDERGLTNPEESVQDFQSVMKEIQSVRDWGNNKFQEYERKMGALEASMPLFMDLVDFRLTHQDADWKRVMDRAKKDGLKNFELAYQLEYGEELKEKEVNEKLERRLAEEKSKAEAETKLPEFTPGQPMFSPEEKSKPAESWSGASARFKEAAATLPGKPA